MAVTNFFATLMLVLTTQLVAVMLPGPDFIIVSQTAIMHEKRQALQVVAGIVCANSLQLLLCVFGLTLVTQQYFLLLSLVKLLAAGYLFYLGLRGLLGRQEKSVGSEPKSRVSHRLRFFLRGFFCSVLNAKAFLFFISLFSMLVVSSTSSGQLLGYAFAMLCVSAAWFTLLVHAVKNVYFERLLWRFKKPMHYVLSSLLIVCALFILLSGI